MASPEQLKDRLTREIAGMIATGHARDGARLLSERRLAALFGVSRASVREALAALKAEGSWWRRALRHARGRRADLARRGDLDHLQHVAPARLLEVCGPRAAPPSAAADRDFADLRRILAEMGPLASQRPAPD